MTEKISETYLDDQKNIQFDDFYLEEITETNKPEINKTVMEKLIENFLEGKEIKSETQNLVRISKDFVIEKFTERNTNVYQWIQDFNKECERFQIKEDKEKIEILKNFLGSSILNWYSCMLMKYTIESEWKKCEEIFVKHSHRKGGHPLDTHSLLSIKQVHYLTLL